MYLNQKTYSGQVQNLRWILLTIETAVARHILARSYMYVSATAKLHVATRYVILVYFVLCILMVSHLGWRSWPANFPYPAPDC